MFESKYQEGDSFIHRADPRIRILSGLLLSFSTALLKKIEVSLFFLFFSFFLLFLSKIPFRKVIKSLFFANFFIGFLWLFVPFSLPGDILFQIWKLKATKEGIKLATLITLKCNAILIIIILFVATIPIHSLGHALNEIGLPNKLVLIFLMSYRYITVIKDEYSRLMQAARLRCFSPKTDLHTYRTYAYLIAMVFIRSYERGIRIYNAMLLRGFRGRFYSLKEFSLNVSDVLILLSAFLISLAIHFAERWLY